MHGQDVLPALDAPLAATSTADAAYDAARAALLIARMERIPFSRWHTRARVVMGSNNVDSCNRT